MLLRVFAAALILAVGICIGRTSSPGNFTPTFKTKIAPHVRTTKSLEGPGVQSRTPSSVLPVDGGVEKASHEQRLAEILADMTMSQISEFFYVVRVSTENVWINKFKGMRVGDYFLRDQLKEHRKYISDLSGNLSLHHKSYRLRGDWRSEEVAGTFDILVESTVDPRDDYNDKCLRIHAHFFNGAIDILTPVHEEACIDRIVLRDGTYYYVLPVHNDLMLGPTFSMIAIPMPFGAKHDFEFIPDGGNSWITAASKWEVLSQEQGWELIGNTWNMDYNEWQARDAAKHGSPPPKNSDENGKRD